MTNHTPVTISNHDNRGSQMTCPHCGNVCPQKTSICCHCGRRSKDYRMCSECCEPIANDARYCPYCTQRVRRAVGQISSDKPTMDFEFRANRIGAFLSSGIITTFFKPPVIKAKGDKITLTRWTLFTLRTSHHEISLERLASVYLMDGVIWARLRFETLGGASTDMEQGGLSKRKAKQMAKLVEAAMKPMD